LTSSLSIFTYSSVHLSQGAGARVLHGERLPLEAAVEVRQVRGRLRQPVLRGQDCEEAQGEGSWLYEFEYIKQISPFQLTGAHGVQQQPQVHQELGHRAQVRMHQEMLLTERCDYPIARAEQ